MQYCYKCKIKIITKTDSCPLCHQKIEPDWKVVETYPQYIPLKEPNKKYAQIISIVSLILIVLSFNLNLFVIKGSNWSVFFATCIIYFWLLGLLTFNRKVHLGLKLFAHASTLPIVLILANMFATNEKEINNITWAISYATPFIILCFTLIIRFIILKRKQKIRDYLVYQLALCFMGFIPLAIVLYKAARPLYPSTITALYSYFTIISLFVFSRRMIKVELKKKFHWQ